LQAEVVALRATVAGLHLELATAQAELVSARAATAAIVPAQSPLGIRWVGLDLPMVPAVPAVPLAQHAPEHDGEKTIEIDLREIIAQADIVLSALPEAALLDPKQARDIELSDPAAAVASAADDSSRTRRTA
jgi:hypothetical protein